MNHEIVDIIRSQLTKQIKVKIQLKKTFLNKVKTRNAISQLS